VCPFFPKNISKTDPARTTERDKEMYHDESRKPVYYFGVKRSRSRVTKTPPAWVVALFGVTAASSSLFLIFLLINCVCRLNNTLPYITNTAVGHRRRSLYDALRLMPLCLITFEYLPPPLQCSVISWRHKPISERYEKMCHAKRTGRAHTTLYRHLQSQINMN